MSRRILLSLREDWQAGRHEREGIWNILNCSPLKFVCFLIFLFLMKTFPTSRSLALGNDLGMEGQTPPVLSVLAA